MHFVACNTMGHDVLYTWSVNNLSAQFRVAQSKIESLESFERPINAEIMTKKIRQCVQQHQQVCDLVSQLNCGFWPIILAEFMVNSGQLCFIGYQIGRLTDVLRTPLLLSFMSTIFLQLLLYCHASQRLEEEVF